MISSGSCVFKTIGIASIFPYFLKRIAFHSITGSQASGQMFHNHNTADQSEIIATELFFQV
jgi:hypothetical protein